MISPVISASGETSARASPNFTVVSLTLDCAGSVQDGTETFVENNTHVARIVVGNSGSAPGSVIVTLPVLFIFVYFEKYLVSGLTAGSVKG